MFKYRVLMTSVSGMFGPKNIELMKNSIKDKVWVLGVDIHYSLAADMCADKFKKVMPGSDINYINEIIKLIKLYNINFVLPCSDEEALNLSINRKKIESAGATLATVHKNSINIMSNKILTYELMEKFNISVPAYKVASSIKDLDAFAKDFYKKYESFVIKQPIARGNRGTIIVDKLIKGKLEYMDSRELHVGWNFYKKEILPNFTYNFPILITEKLYKPAFDIDILAKKGKIIHVVPRERINPAGVPYKGNIIRNNKKLIELAEKVAKTMNLSWLYDLDIMTNKDGNPTVLEVNPRPSGSAIASMECGIPLYRDLLHLNEKKKFNKVQLPPDGTIIFPSFACNIIYPKK